MARKTLDITITDEKSRDFKKEFRITELDAERAEDWAIRAFMGLSVGGVVLPTSIPKTLPGLAMLGVQTLGRIPYEMARPLLNEMMSCVQVITSSGAVRKAAAGEIEEFSTLLELRKQVIEVHTGFFEHVANSNLMSSLSAAAKAADSTSPSA